MKADIYTVLKMLIAVAALPDGTKETLTDVVEDLKEQDALGINARLSTREIRNVRSTNV